MIRNMSNYLTSKNASVGLKQAIADAEPGDTLFFDIKDSYHFYKDYCEHKIYHMTNTDSFVKPDKYFAVLAEDKSDITIDGNGSTFVIHGDMCALALIRSKNIVLKNFRIQYNSPTNFEMKVVSKKRNKIVYSIPESSNFVVKNNSITFFEQSPFTKKNYYEYKNNQECHCNVIHRDNEVFRTLLSPIKTAVRIKRLSAAEVECTYIIPPKFSVGDSVAMSRNFCRDNCGLFFWECSNITSENIIVNYMHGFGWLSQMCENLTFNKIQFTPDRERGYNVSSFADCIHVCGCKGYVKINECFFEHPHDDGINIHGAFLRLKNVIDAKTAVFEFVHKQQGGYKNFFSGDKVKLYSRLDLSELDGIYTVKETIDDIDNKLVTISFEEELPPMKSKMVVAENITYNPKVSITNCTFFDIPTRGILCTTTEDSDISFNTFENLKMPDIFISCDCKDWYESGPCKSLKIHHNRFSQKDAVKFEPICVGTPVANVHENITISDNEMIEA
ncbi:MAG: hypothetical protein NC397_03175 [Clostridium sp.]|nr:hypothetical protein [Clostridium sp.]